MFPWSSPVTNLKVMTPPRGTRHIGPDRHCFDPTDTCPGVIREGCVTGAAESTGLVSAVVEVVRSRQESVQFSAGALVAGIGDSLQLHQVPRGDRAAREQLASVHRPFVQELAQLLDVAALVCEIRQAIKSLFVPLVRQSSQGF